MTMAKKILVTVPFTAEQREALQQGVRIQFIFTGAGALNQQQEIQDILKISVERLP